MNLFYQEPRIGQQLLDVPMGRMIKDMAFSIAEAQMKLDENSMEVAEMMGGLSTIRDEVSGEVTFEDSRVFFGQERLLVSNAIEAYNSSADLGFKKLIDEKLQQPVNYKNFKLEPTLPAAPDANSKKYINVTAADATNGYYQKQEPTSGTFSYVLIPSKPTDIQIESSLSPSDSFILIPQRLSMMELGFTPTFYQFVDTIIEVKISIKYTREGSYSRSTSSTQKKRSGGISFGFRRGLRAKTGLRTSQVNATYSQKYTYSAEGSSLLRTKLVPIPPPSILEERIQQQMEIARAQALPPATSS